jgi:hypothetical protein
MTVRPSLGAMRSRAHGFAYRVNPGVSSPTSGLPHRHERGRAEKIAGTIAWRGTRSRRGRQSDDRIGRRPRQGRATAMATKLWVRRGVPERIVARFLLGISIVRDEGAGTGRLLPLPEPMHSALPKPLS